jgi:predicted Fe-Mo cluster-binding NifX family protein
MLIAIALDASDTISSHLGQSECFAVYEVGEGGQRLVERRANPHLGHCSGHHAPGPGHEAHGHHGGGARGAWIPPVMSDCAAVIAGFIPPPAQEVLRSIDVQPVLAAPGSDPMAALAAFLDQAPG